MTHNDLPLNFSYGAWEKFKIKDVSDFIDLPNTAVVAILIAMVLFDISSSFLLLKLIYTNTSCVKLLFTGVHSFICPPLHLDWELFYRNDPRKNTVLGSWKRCARANYFHHVGPLK